MLLHGHLEELPAPWKRWERDKAHLLPPRAGLDIFKAWQKLFQLLPEGGIADLSLELIGLSVGVDAVHFSLCNVGLLIRGEIVSAFLYRAFPQNLLQPRRGGVKVDELLMSVVGTGGYGLRIIAADVAVVQEVRKVADVHFGKCIEVRRALQETIDFLVLFFLLKLVF